MDNGRRVAALLVLGVLSACADGETRPVPDAERQLPLFAFWLKEGVEDDDRAVEVDGHPCGAVALLRTDQIPPPDDERLDADDVIERDDQNLIVRQWRTPVDVLPAGLRGNELLIDSGSEMFWIDTQGRIRGAGRVHAPSGVPLACGREPELQPSGYLMCTRFPDLESGRERRLSYQAVCS